MKKFLTSLLVFGVLFFAYDKLFIVFKNQSADKEADKRLELVLQGKINKDIIVLGASRGANNIIAGQIEKETGHSAYNISYAASDVEFHEFLLRMLLKHNKAPKIILFPLDDPNELFETHTQGFRYERLYPLVKYDDVNDELVARGEKNSLFSKLFVLHRINKTNLNLKQKQFTPEETVLPCGSMPIPFQKPGCKWVYEYANNTYDVKDEVPAKLKTFQKIVDDCRKNNIQLIFVTTPNFRKSNPLFEKRMSEIAGQDIPVFHFNDKNPIYRDPQYFYNESHLNTKGAVILTHEIADYLNQNIYKKPTQN
jgi:hypothetical protein